MSSEFGNIDFSPTGKADHVWMDIHGFENFKVDDRVSFYAEVYRYIKTGNGKILNCSLRN